MGKRYDVFLSCKNLGPDGKPTRDSLLAENIYQHLLAHKLSVFLSTLELEALGVSAYKEVIDSALDASRVLVAIGTSTANLESKWVRYEWDGFFNDILSGVKPDGKVFSYIDGVQLKSLPRALRQCQAVTHGDDSLDQIYRFIANALSVGSEAASELWKDSIWDRLLDSLEERCVIPIVGPDLVQVEIDGTTTTLDQYLARRLAQNYKLPLDNLPSERALNDVVCQLFRLRKDRYAICDDIFQIMKQVDSRPSRSLRQLAEITDFDLFVSTTFDSFLEKAINDVRFAGALRTLSIAYSSKRVDDLPSSKAKLTRPTVYYLMGKLSATGAYATSDEDLIERLFDLQSPEARPARLFDELKKNHLLILGQDFSDSLFAHIPPDGKGQNTLVDPRVFRDPG